jgi:hypothetical protein
VSRWADSGQGKRSLVRMAQGATGQHNRVASARKRSANSLANSPGASRHKRDPPCRHNYWAKMAPTLRLLFWVPAIAASYLFATSWRWTTGQWLLKQLQPLPDVLLVSPIPVGHATDINFWFGQFLGVVAICFGMYLWLNNTSLWESTVRVLRLQAAAFVQAQNAHMLLPMQVIPRLFRSNGQKMLFRHLFLRQATLLPLPQGCASLHVLCCVFLQGREGCAVHVLLAAGKLALSLCCGIVACVGAWHTRPTSCAAAAADPLCASSFPLPSSSWSAPGCLCLLAPTLSREPGD